MMILKIVKKNPLVLPLLLIAILLPWISPNPYITRVLMEVFFFAAMGNA